jgi:hypothetical protein
LKPEQREDQVTPCQDIIVMTNGVKYFFNKIVMGNEACCFAYDPKTKRQSSEWVGETSPWPKKLKFQKSHIKTMLIIFFNSRGVVHKELVPERKTVNAEFYKGVTDCFLKRIQWVRPAVFCSQDFFMLHHNVPTHTVASVGQFLIQKNFTILYHPLYSPDLSLLDYFLFPMLKMKLKGLHFLDVAEIKEAVTNEVKKAQKRGILGSFSETVQRHKNPCICQWSLF